MRFQSSLATSLSHPAPWTQHTVRILKRKSLGHLPKLSLVTRPPFTGPSSQAKKTKFPILSFLEHSKMHGVAKDDTRALDCIKRAALVPLEGTSLERRVVECIPESARF